MNSSKKSLISLAVSSALVGSVFLSSNIQAESSMGSFSANVALTSDYYFRGISQTNNDGAIQGGFDWSHDSGVYAGVWASNVAFGSTNIEADTYIGYGNEVSGFGYDLGWIRYNYNDTNYIPDFDKYTIEEMRSVLEEIFGYTDTVSWDDSKVELHFNYIISKYTADLEKDASRFS